MCLLIAASFSVFSSRYTQVTDNTSARITIFGGVTHIDSEHESLFKSPMSELGVNLLKNYPSGLSFKAQTSLRPALQNKVGLDWFYLNYEFSKNFSFDVGLLDANMGLQGSGIQNPYARYSVIPIQSTMFTTTLGVASLMTGVRASYKRYISALATNLSLSATYGEPRFSPSESESILSALLKETWIEGYPTYDSKWQVELKAKTRRWDLSLTIDDIGYTFDSYNLEQKHFRQMVASVRRASIRTEFLAELYLGNANPLRSSDFNKAPIPEDAPEQPPFAKGGISGFNVYVSQLLMDRVTMYGGISLFYFDTESPHGDYWESVRPEGEIYQYPKEFRYNEDLMLGFRYDFTDDQALTFEIHRSKGVLANHYNYFSDPQAKSNIDDTMWYVYALNWSFMF
jgi:hypothetical protein